MEQPGADLAAVIDECVSADTTLDTQQKAGASTGDQSV